MAESPHRLFRVRLTGRGGQGIMLAGAILAHAAMHEGRQVTETQEYGPEARLGATKAEVILSDREIAFPMVSAPDVLVCLSRQGFIRYGQQIAPGGTRLVEQTALPAVNTEPGLWSFPWRAEARRLGQELVTNIVALGTFAAMVDAVSLDGLQAAIRQRVKPDFAELNLVALYAGYRMGKQAPQSSPRPSAS